MTLVPTWLAEGPALSTDSPPSPSWNIWHFSFWSSFVSLWRPFGVAPTFVFFLSGCCMAQRVVVRAVALLSATTKWKVAKFLDMCFQVKQQIRKQKETTPTTLQSPGECRGGGEGGLFLGQLDQGLVGNAESTHVNRPKGKAPVVPNVGRYCRISKEHIVKRPATSMLSRVRE